jgi:hypothetical protein
MKLSLAPLAASLSFVVACAPPLRAPRSAPSPAPSPSPAAAVANRPPDVDRHAQAEHDAADVFRAMHGDLLACITRAPALPRDATADVVVDVLVAPDGSVRDVATTGGARVGTGAIACMQRRIARASFAPPRGGGTSRIQVPFAFSFEP